MALQDALVWVDLEMTGLDPDRDRVIEIATIVTDSHLQVLAEGPVLAIHQDEAVLATMDDWNQRQHGQSGLLERVRASVLGEAAVQDLTIDFLSRYAEAGKSPMCGNSICQDRRFMVRHLPRLESFFHYRNLDVSTIKELARRCLLGLEIKRRPRQKHRHGVRLREFVDPFIGDVEEMIGR